MEILRPHQSISMLTKIMSMRKTLHKGILLTAGIFFLPLLVIAQGGRVDVGKSFLNISKLNGGGTFNPGDTIEVRVTVAVKTQTTRTIIDSLQVFDQVPLKTTYITGSMRVTTNQGITYKGPFSEVQEADWGKSLGGGITSNMGKYISGIRGGYVRSDSSKPSFYNSHCIMVACYRVRINPLTPYGDSIVFNTGSVRYRMLSPTVSLSVVNFPISKIKLIQASNACEFGSNMSAASDSLGTFASGTTANRATPVLFGTSYIKQNVSTNQPNDYYYSIVNNSSANGSTNVNAPMPESPATQRVFGQWDIGGDHTGASNQALGNPPVAPGTRGGYFVLVNASYNTDVAYQETLSNLCPNTYYEFSAWFRNVCPRCSCDSNGRGSRTIGFIPYPGNDSAGVRPNLSFEIDGFICYTTGDIRYDRVIPWKKFGFTFLTRGAQNIANFVIRNNSPGGGGNDWAIDDIKVAHCGPRLSMNITPTYLGCREATNIVSLSDTIRHMYNSYVYYQWQVSNVGGTVWTNLIGPGTSGVGTPTLVSGYYQYITNLPPFIATYADSGKYYRVIVGTTAANLNSAACAYTDGSATMLQIITCGVVLKGNFLQLKGNINNTGNAFLTWNTQGEEDLSYYEVECSDDGVNYRSIGMLNARNMPFSSYHFTDPERIVGNKYYRLKMVGQDVRTFKYSHAILLGKSFLTTVKVVENPFSSRIKVDAIVPADVQLRLYLFDEKGRRLKENILNLKKGLNQVYIDNLQGIASGVYILSAELPNESYRFKVVKK